MKKNKKSPIPPNLEAWGKRIFLGAPDTEEAMFRQCEIAEDFLPILRPWYAYVASLLLDIPSPEPTKNNFYRDIPDKHLAILRGLLRRAAQLMASSLKLTVDAKHWEAFAILQRCVMEALIKCRWFICEDSEDEYQRFICFGLKTNLKLRDALLTNVKQRGFKSQLHHRLLDSVDYALEISDVTAKDVKTAKKFPDQHTLLTKLKIEDQYVFYQRIPSDEIHSNWPALMTSQLEYKDGYFHLQRDMKRVNQNWFMATIYMGLTTLHDYASYAITGRFKSLLIDVIETTRKEIEPIREAMAREIHTPYDE